MPLLETKALYQSSVVANSMMNRERGCVGGNSYAKELSLDPIDFLRARLSTQAHVSWLDLCCGSGKALIEAAHVLTRDGAQPGLSIIGLDLVGMFDNLPNELNCLRLHETSTDGWESSGAFDLITCVHGLHYIGDKLDLIVSAMSWLKSDGIFAANLDVRNIRFTNGEVAGMRVIRELRKCGVDYNTRKHLLVCNGRIDFRSAYEYVGADDTAGPNYTGQPAVDSYYRVR